MKKTILSVLAVAAFSSTAMAQDFCTQLANEQTNLKACTDNTILSNNDFRKLQHLIQENDREIRGPRANDERAKQLSACQGGNTKLQAVIAASNAALDSARRSVSDITTKKNELVRFLGENMKSTFECVAIDPKYGNSADVTGQPNVFYGTGRTEADAINNMYTVAATRGNTAVNRLKRSYKCFEVLNREAAQRFEGDVRALGQAANQVGYAGTVVEVVIDNGGSTVGGSTTGGGRDGGGRDGGGRDGGGSTTGGGRDGGGRQGGTAGGGGRG